MITKNFSKADNDKICVACCCVFTLCATGLDGMESQTSIVAGLIQKNDWESLFKNYTWLTYLEKAMFGYDPNINPITDQLYWLGFYFPKAISDLTDNFEKERKFTRKHFDRMVFSELPNRKKFCFLEDYKEIIEIGSSKHYFMKLGNTTAETVMSSDGGRPIGEEFEVNPLELIIYLNIGW